MPTRLAAIAGLERRRRRASIGPATTLEAVSATSTHRRFDRIDALRGVAIVWMTAFHFCFDLDHFGWIRQNLLSDPFWTRQRTAIVTLFLFCAGLGQAVAFVQGQGWPRFWRRWAQIAGCALLVTVGSAFMFPDSFIYFGVLHGIALMLVIVRLTARWGRWLWLAGALALLLPLAAVPVHMHFGDLAVLNGRWLNWIGFISSKPVTQDYVPLLPWLGVMWWGMAAGQWLLRARPAVVQGPIPRAFTPLAWLGRWSLSWYLVHQPVLIGLLMLLHS
ncbi:MAG: putative rane protein [Ramlibacter sp.]|nr:putative rane protein [Ramlibacter sp.]